MGKASFDLFSSFIIYDDIRHCELLFLLSPIGAIS